MITAQEAIERLERIGSACSPNWCIEIAELIRHQQSDYKKAISHIAEIEESEFQLQSQNAQLREALRVTAIRCFNIGCLHGHEDTVEGRFVVVLPQDLDSYNSELVDEMLTDGSLPEAKQAIAETPAPERVEKSELETANAKVNALSGVLANIADTCRSRGFPAGKPIDERVIALAQDRDQARAELEAANAFNESTAPTIELLKQQLSTSRGLCEEIRKSETSLKVQLDQARAELSEARASHGKTLLLCEKTIERQKWTIMELQIKSSIHLDTGM